MTHFNIGYYHLYKRKSANKKPDQYSYDEKWKRLLDKAMFVIGLTGPFMMIPKY